MKRRVIKKQIFTLLENPDWKEVERGIRQFAPQQSLHALFTALCSSNERCKWHAVSCFGIVVPMMAEDNLESARVVMRRFLWSLNDESGGIGWGIPEAMGEVTAESEVLFSEYGHLLLSYMREDGPEILQDGNYLELPALQQGLIWAIARLLAVRKKELLSMGVVADLQKYLSSGDRIVRALTAWCLGKCGSSENLKQISALTGDHFPFTLYWENCLQETTVAALASQALQEIRIQQ
tara:strand:- start:303 stop:1013 length:711 start_codon:yes stop_codon:yes gene_type:complete